MTWYTVEHSCGDTERRQITGSNAATASLIRTPNQLEITCAGSEFYRGTMPISQAWVDDVTARAHTRNRRAVHSDVVMVTGPITDPAGIDAVLYAGRASWVRIPLTMT